LGGSADWRCGPRYGAKLFTPSVIVDVAAPEAMAPLFEVDSNYGRWPADAILASLPASA
jgi:hypothetical protein